jgi:hypothetical protein
LGFGQLGLQIGKDCTHFITPHGGNYRVFPFPSKKLGITLISLVDTKFTAFTMRIRAKGSCLIAAGLISPAFRILSVQGSQREEKSEEKNCGKTKKEQTS